ncbi:2-haloacrylate reductase [Streptomyces sp. RB5]|uniref:2-haloacrylate reductase n=1 Tax=Streptomyces smaragdinus TaxID=2585196 RepID=A0A7K0CQ26_9ACTN|nr:NADP-dependent oxidoreductase [Streptomyces smaragdinus]MQY15559.1 2-haloacrylate reductase [Streptomyces smaragdinus]
MRAVIVTEPGGPEALRVVETAVPEPGPGQVRIRVGAAGVNPVDTAVRAGVFVQVGVVAERARYGVGWDAAGVVDAVGAGVTGVAVGDSVVALLDLLDLELGAYAEQLVVDAYAVAPAPRGTDAAHAATLPLNALTADQSLAALALEPGQTLLVTGAAGAVGGYGVELAAKDRGLRVVAQAGPGDEALVRGLGAAEFVPRDAVLAAAVRAVAPGGVHGVLDAASVGAGALAALRPRGRFAAVLPSNTPLPLRGTTVHLTQVYADGARLAELTALADKGVLTPRVADTLPLERAAEAHERLARGGVRGRLVLVP